MPEAQQQQDEDTDEDNEPNYRAGAAEPLDRSQPGEFGTGGIGEPRRELRSVGGGEEDTVHGEAPRTM
ncbi:MAG: hypothetical protein JO108_30665 [Acidobacteriaceae bacterium]|nr:hypothetical protein [Acidobacteriaceae bacterium]